MLVRELKKKKRGLMEHWSQMDTGISVSQSHNIH